MALQAVVLQDLRNAARVHGWTVRGTAKADVVQGLVEHLSNADEMAAAFAQLPAFESKVLIWLAHLRATVDSQNDSLATILRIAEEERATREAVVQTIGNLYSRLFVLVDPATQLLQVPDLYLEWLPESDAPGLVYQGNVSNVLSVPGQDWLDRHCARLLTVVEEERPPVERAALVQPMSQPSGRPTPGMVPSYQCARPHGGIVSDERLVAWGFGDPEERALARTLLSLLAIGGLCRVYESGGTSYLRVDPAQVDAWLALAPDARRSRLRSWWLNGWPATTPPAVHTLLTWNELDVFLSTQERYSLRQSTGWINRDYLDVQVRDLRRWLVHFMSAIQTDVWISMTRLFELLYALRRDLLAVSLPYGVWNWYDGESRIDLQHIQRQAWSDLFGRLVEGWLAPAYWLGFIQMATVEDRVVAICRPAATAAPARPQPLPADVLSFLPDGRLSLRSTWQTGDLRQLIQKIASVVARDRQTIIFAPDPAVFRQTLRSGQSAAQIGQAFADAGFPLPAELQRRLQEWQDRLGRHQIYDNVAVIEFGDDHTMAEVQAVVNLNQGDCYPVSTRHLVVLRPETIPVLIEELRRKGYTPQVLA